MKVLFTCVVGYGHLHPMLPLARALQHRGHEVEFASDPDLAGYIASLGFAAHPAGLNHAQALGQLRETISGPRTVPGTDGIRNWFAPLFVRIRVPPMLDDLSGLIEERRPDLLIHGCMEMAGGIAATAAGIPHAEHSFGVMRPAELMSLALVELRPIAQAHGVEEPSLGGRGGEPYIALCPPALEDPDIATIPDVLRLRPVGTADLAGETLPGWVSGLGRRPAVYVTLGTVFNQAVHLFAAIIDGLRKADVDVVLTIGKDGDPDALGPLPAHVHVERYIPQSLLLPHCALVIHHGGSGTMLGAISAGLPQLAVPQAADQFINATAITRTGLGLALNGPDFSSEAVARDSHALLTDPAFARRARQVALELDAMPPPEDVAQALEQRLG